MESSRLPNKPLLPIAGIPMIIHVAKRSLLSKFSERTIVCTDSPEIAFTCADWDVEVCLTRFNHINGTERIAEAVEILQISPSEIVVDVQGDEPLVQPEYIDSVIQFMKEHDFDCVVPYQNYEVYDNINRVKIVSSGDRIIYFSRSDVPNYFGSAPKALKKHLSIIGFTGKSLLNYQKMPVGELETTERIELFRMLEHGANLGTFESSGESLSVDTIEDYQQVCRVIERDHLFISLKDKGIL